MTLFEYCMQFLSEICEGKRPAPAGFSLPEGGEEARAAALQAQIRQAGVPAFVRACAAESGLEIPQSEYDAFGRDEPPAAPPEAEPVRSEVREIYEVFLDSVCLDDDIFTYLIDVLKRRDKQEFETLSHAAARTILDMDEFLLWLGNKELLAPPEERDCAVIMDGCFERLRREGENELLAALLSGDETTFRIFRTQAPELLHLPEASFSWFDSNYLARYYPARFLMKCSGVIFPEAGAVSDDRR